MFFDRLCMRCLHDSPSRYVLFFQIISTVPMGLIIEIMDKIVR